MFSVFSLVSIRLSGKRVVFYSGEILHFLVKRGLKNGKQ